MLKTSDPRFLWALLIIIGMIGVATSVIACQQDSSGEAPLSEAETQTAVDIARAAGTIERIAGDQAWTSYDFSRVAVAGATNAVEFVASWEQPVESAGPWRELRCEGTVLFEVPKPWINVTRIQVIVDVDRQEVVGLAVIWEPEQPLPGKTPRPHPSNPPSPDYGDSPMAVYDLKTRQVLYSGLVKDEPSEVRACPPLMVIDHQAAVEIAREAGVVDRIAGGQPWTPSNFARRTIAGTADGGVVFTATWDQPVESSGPWQDLECQDTLTYEFSSTWANITRLNVYVDVEHREVVAIIVPSPSPRRTIPGETPQPSAIRISDVGLSDRTTVYDLENRRVIFEGLVMAAPKCPPGKEDD